MFKFVASKLNCKLNIMRKIIFVLMAVALSVAASAQKGKVTSAESFITQGAFDKAKTAIEEAILNPKSAEWSRTYYVKGKLCQSAFESGNEKFMTIYPDILGEAYRNYEKALQMDPKMKNLLIRENTYASLGNAFLNDAIAKFQAKDFTSALKSFEENVKIASSDVYVGVVDSLVIFNAGLAAYNAQMYPEAIAHFRTCTTSETEDTKPYIFISDCYLKMKDTVNAEAALLEGYKMYPDTLDIILQATQFYIDTENPNKAFEFVSKAMEKDPGNYVLYLVEGSLYMKLGENEKAIESFQKSLELNSTQFESNYNTGYSYVLIANKKLDDASLITDNKQYEAAKTAAFEEYKKAIPFFLEAEKANPSSQATLEFLREIYFKVKMMPEYEVYKKKLSEL
jgi:tetratricopeptide (TPR) repeat protein